MKVSSMIQYVDSEIVKLTEAQSRTVMPQVLRVDRRNFVSIAYGVSAVA